MTVTANSGPEGQHLLYNSDDVEYKQPAKPAKRPSSSGAVVGNFPIFETELQRAMRPFENSTVATLDRLIKNDSVLQIQRITDDPFRHLRIPEPLIELERIQRLIRPFNLNGI